MNNTKSISAAVVVIVIVIALWLIVHNRGTLNSTNMGANTASSSPSNQFPATSSPITIENYMRQNIAALSPIMPSLGGSWYVTNIEAHGGAGTVTYEDGHTQVIADFTYAINEQGVPRITSFAPRQ